MASIQSSGWVPQHTRDITLGRLAGFVSETWAQANLQSVLYHHAPGTDGLVDLQVWSPEGAQTRPSFEDARNQQFKTCKVGDAFGPSWSTHWFRVSLRVPDTWTDVPPDTPLLFVWDSGSEAMVWTETDNKTGRPRQGLTDQRNEYVLDSSVLPGATYQLYVEMACNGVGGVGEGIQPPPPDKQYTLKTVCLAVPDLLAQQLQSDFLLVSDIAKSLPADSALGCKALYVANSMINTFRRDDRATWQAARDLARDHVLQRGADSLHKVTAVGHCHIDTAWLWPFDETRRKVARSWSAQLQLLARYPDHVFAASSAQQYAWLQSDYPSLWEELGGAVAEGRFVPVGGTWVEMDTNLPSGESLVRQLLYGQRFFETAFGKRCEVFWLPDTFGYAAQLPQLIRGAGMRYFLTQKLSWNNINAFPHNTFLWQALDGTDVLTHFPPSNTYNSQATVSDVLMSVTNHKDKDRSPASLLLFGNGDGGGGPTQPMCEAMARLADRDGQGIQGLVSCVQGSPNDFFREAEEGARNLLTWRGELYFELHRGTYTSHAANKRDNRRCEEMLRQTEILCAQATALGLAKYPHKELYALWTEVLLYQFHDVLPGSAIGLVYGHTAQAYPRILSQIQALRDTAALAVLQSSLSHTRNTHSLQTLRLAHDTTQADKQLTKTAATATASSIASTASTAAHQPVYDAVGQPAAASVTMSQPTAASAGACTALSQPAAANAATHAAGGDHTCRMSDSVLGGSRDSGEYVFVGLSVDDVAGARVVTHPPSPPHTTCVTEAASATTHTANQGPEQRTTVSTEAYSTAAETPMRGVCVESGAGAGGVLCGAGVGVGEGVGVGGDGGEGGVGVWAWNPLCCARHEVVSVPVNMVPGGSVVPQMASDKGPTPGSALFQVSLPPMGFAQVTTSPAPPNALTLTTQGSNTRVPATGVQHCEGCNAGLVAGANGEMVYHLMNRHIRAVFDTRGRLISLCDRQSERELVPEGGLGNRFRLYEDIPLFWDAWDVEIYHLEKGWDAGVPTRIEVVESGPLRSCLLWECDITPLSRVRQCVYVTADSPLLEFKTHVDWHETYKLLKVEFPWTLQSDNATYEVQFGAVTRPTHTNTSWDWARFEVVAHKWADLSEPDYGVSLINDCKYGHATHGNVQRLTLLKSPKAPDANTDMGEHTIRYAIMPHAAGWQAAGTVAHARAFNAPPLLVALQQTPHNTHGHTHMLLAPPAPPAPGPTPPDLSEPFVQVERIGPSPGISPCLVIDTVKLADPPLTQAHNGSYSQSSTQQQLIVRLYEPHGCRGKARLRLTSRLLVVRAALTNLLEDTTSELPVQTSAPKAASSRTGLQTQTEVGPSDAVGVCKGGGWVEVAYTPFQVLTVALWVQPAARWAAPTRDHLSLLHLPE